MHSLAQIGMAFTNTASTADTPTLDEIRELIRSFPPPPADVLLMRIDTWVQLKQQIDELPESFVPGFGFVAGMIVRTWVTPSERRQHIRWAEESRLRVMEVPAT
jgi:hypothetical protein